MPEIMEQLPVFIKRMTQVITNNIHLFIEVGKALIKAFFEGIWASFKGFLSSIGSYIDTLIYDFKRWLGMSADGNSTTFKDIGKNVLESLKNGFIYVWNTLTSKVQEIINSVISKFQGMSLWEIGQNLIQGLWNGMQNKADGIKAGVKTLANGIVGVAQSAFKIGSPSKVFEYIGEMNMLGLQNGMKEKETELQRTIDGMFMLQPNVSPMMTITEGNPMTTMFSNFLNNMQERPVEIEVRADEGIIVKKVVQGFREFQRANGTLPF